MSHAYAKRSALSLAQLDTCFEEEYHVTETPPTAQGFWWVACKERVWKCRYRVVLLSPRAMPPECHLDESFTPSTIP
jgi:hypothetical protein